MLKQPKQDLSFSKFKANQSNKWNGWTAVPKKIINIQNTKLIQTRDS